MWCCTFFYFSPQSETHLTADESDLSFIHLVNIELCGVCFCSKSLILGCFKFFRHFKISDLSVTADVSASVFVYLQHMNIRGSESGIKAKGVALGQNLRVEPPTAAFKGPVFCPLFCHITKNQFWKVDELKQVNWLFSYLWGAWRDTLVR